MVKVCWSKSRIKVIIEKARLNFHHNEIIRPKYPVTFISLSRLRMGGACECFVKATKKVLKSEINDQPIRKYQLTPTLVEIERVVNS